MTSMGITHKANAVTSARLFWRGQSEELTVAGSTGATTGIRTRLPDDAKQVETKWVAQASSPAGSGGVPPLDIWWNTEQLF
ncbi:MAG: hypothetical protein ACREIC_17730 [Limisphaerales bacterium]